MMVVLHVFLGHVSTVLGHKFYTSNRTTRFSRLECPLLFSSLTSPTVDSYVAFEFLLQELMLFVCVSESVALKTASKNISFICK